MDRLMSRCGLSGKSFIPLLSSMACAVPGILATRVIENRRDRLATILVAPLMSCSARLPVYVLLIGCFLSPPEDATWRDFSWWLPGLVMFALYCLGLVTAPLAALLLKRTLLRGETPLFVLEMPLYKRPSLRTVFSRMFDATGHFLKRAGTFILASMILVWALLYFPRGESNEARAAFAERLKQDCDSVRQEAETAEGDDRAAKDRELSEKTALLERVERSGVTYDVHCAYLRKEAEDAADELKEAEKNGTASKEKREQVKKAEDEANALYGEWQRGSVLGRTGRLIEPVVRPLGWDWRIGMAALASFPAREVVVGTLGIIYNVGKVDSDEIRKSSSVSATPLGRALRSATWEDDPKRKVFTIPVALSLMVFFALCCQCASTLAVIRRETKSWRWPAFTFAYMTALAYVAALLTYQIGSWIA
jgi:ferrous iron transport protein B